MLVYSYQEAEVWHEEYKSNKFVVERGVRQGCLLSPLLFRIVIEILVILVHQQEDVKGIQIYSTENKVLLCADDVVFVLQQPISSLKMLKLHITKEVKEEMEQFDLTLWHITIKHLGVTITIPLTNKNLVAQNLNPLINDIKHQINGWYCKRLSWFRRRMVLKMKILPQILFIFRSLLLCIPRKKLAEIQ